MILLLFQLMPTSVMTYPFDKAHCYDDFKYLNRSFNNLALKILYLFFYIS